MTTATHPKYGAHKICKDCKQEKSVAEFGANGRYLRSYCRLCNAARARQWFQDNREQGRNTKFRGHLRNNYDMTMDEYDALLEAQEDVCAICGGTNPNHGRYGTQFRLSVDHDHETGKVRGLLCNNCNRAIGLLSDDVDLLRHALDYLGGHH